MANAPGMNIPLAAPMRAAMGNSSQRVGWLVSATKASKQLRTAWALSVAIMTVQGRQRSAAEPPGTRVATRAMP